MSLEKHKAIIRKATEALDRHDLSSLDRFFSTDYFNHAYQFRSLEDLKQYYSRLYRGFPDWHETIEDIVAEGDKVWVLITYTGKHTGEYRGLAIDRLAGSSQVSEEKLRLRGSKAIDRSMARHSVESS